MESWFGLLEQLDQFRNDNEGASSGVLHTSSGTKMKGEGYWSGLIYVSNHAQSLESDHLLLLITQGTLERINERPASRCPMGRLYSSSSVLPNPASQH